MKSQTRGQRQKARRRAEQRAAADMLWRVYNNRENIGHRPGKTITVVIPQVEIHLPAQVPVPMPCLDWALFGPRPKPIMWGTIRQVLAALRGVIATPATESV